MQIGNANTAVSGEKVHGTLLLYGTGHKQDILRVGQTIQAEVIFSSDEAANVKLSGGPVLRARLAEGVRLAEGDRVWLAVREKNGDRLVLQVVAGEETAAAAPKTPESILSRAGLHPTLLNLSLAKALREAGLSAEVGVILQAAAILEKYPDVDVNAALFTAVNEIDPSYENLMIVSSLQRSDFKVADILLRVFRLLAGRAAPQAEHAPSEQPAGPGERGLDAQSFFAGIKKSEDAETLQKTAARHKDRLEFLKTVVPSGDGEEKSAAAETGRAALLAEDAPSEQPSGPSEQGLDAQSFFGGIEKPEDAETLQKTATQHKDRLESLPSGEGEEKSAAAEMGRAAPLAENTPPEQPAGPGKRGLDAQSFFAEIKKPEDAETLQKTAAQLKGRLEFLKTVVPSGEGKKMSAAAEVDRLLQGIKLFEAIHKYAYMQIPVMLGGRPLTAELYVFRTKKGQKKSGADSLSFLLALDTENLGRIEALVGIQNTCITIRLRVAEEEAAGYLRSCTAALYEMISMQGYRLASVLVQVEKEPVTLMAALNPARLETGNRRLSLRV